VNQTKPAPNACPHGLQPLRQLLIDGGVPSCKVARAVGITPSLLTGRLRGHGRSRLDEIRIAASALLGRELTHDECWTGPLPGYLNAPRNTTVAARRAAAEREAHGLPPIVKDPKVIQIERAERKLARLRADAETPPASASGGASK
jgi:hypothetical protein